MFTLAALGACVFVLIRFCQIQCLIREIRIFHTHGLKHDSTHTEDGNFQLNQIIFLEYMARKAAWVNRGEAVITFLIHNDLSSERDNINNKGRESIASLRRSLFPEL